MTEFLLPFLAVVLPGFVFLEIVFRYVTSEREIPPGALVALNPRLLVKL